MSLNERLSINGAPISSEALESLLSRHAPKVDAVQRTEGGALTHFEVLTALAYQHFQEENVDAVVIETGLGGARDATNVLPTERLQAAIITAVGMDHAGALGEPHGELYFKFSRREYSLQGLGGGVSYGPLFSSAGGTIESIAAAKAGIMKPGKPVVLARQPEPAAEAVLLRHGRQRLGCHTNSCS